MNFFMTSYQEVVKIPTTYPHLRTNSKNTPFDTFQMELSPFHQTSLV